MYSPCRPGSQFQSTPSARRATGSRKGSAPEQEFQSTPSARRATAHSSKEDEIMVISIHALREEGDGPHQPPPRPVQDFNPRPPRGGRPQKPMRGGIRL